MGDAEGAQGALTREVTTVEQSDRALIGGHDEGVDAVEGRGNERPTDHGLHGVAHETLTPKGRDEVVDELRVGM